MRLICMSILKFVLKLFEPPLLLVSKTELGPVSYLQRKKVPTASI